jgi:hypothetical protein
MNLKFLSLTVGMTVSLASAMSWASSAGAQTVEPTNPLADFQSQSNSDPFSGDSQKGMFDLMHRAMQGDVQSAATFSANQQSSLNDATAAFRAKQQLLLKQRQAKSNPQSGAVAPSVPMVVNPSSMMLSPIGIPSSIPASTSISAPVTP